MMEPYSLNAHRGGFSLNHTVHRIYAVYIGHSKTVSRSSLARLEPKLFKFEVDPTCGGKLYKIALAHLDFRPIWQIEGQGANVKPSRSRLFEIKIFSLKI